MGENHDPAPYRSERLRGDLTLLAVALIWGSAFVAQRAGNEHVGPFTFNAVRFALGSLVLLPIVVWRRLRKTANPPANSPQGVRGGMLLGLLLFGGASLQQIGLVYTTAGKAGFITGLYVVIVPLLLALFWRERVRWNNWLGAGLAVVGLFLLSGDVQLNAPTEFTLAPGDAWVLGCAFLWALHVIAVGRLAPGRDAFQLALGQNATCAFLSGGAALALERVAWGSVHQAGPEIVYVGVLSTAIAYTGQILGQRHAPPTDAAIILSLEAAFAALSGWLVLSETLLPWQLAGCGLMLAGMLLAQVRPRSGLRTQISADER